MQIDYYKELADVCRGSYYAFVRHFWHTVIKEPPVFNWHIKYLCDEIQAGMERIFAGKPKEYDLLTNISPGTTKSTLFSVFLTPWAWTRMPHCRVIGASYTDALALDLSGKSRQCVEHALYRRTFPNITLSKDTNSKSHWANNQGGERYAVATEGSVTGKHGHVIIIDDPIDPKGVRSKADLDSTLTWCKETIPSRKVDKEIAMTMVVMQRLHQNDPSEFYLSQPDVKHICLPGVLTDKVKPAHLRDFYVDGLFDPVRLSPKALTSLETALGQFGYSGQILQNPIPLGGGMFKVDRFHVVPYPPGYNEFVRIVRYWDRAATANGGDYTVGVLMGKHKNGSYWVLDIVRGQWSTDAREKVIHETAKRDGRRVYIGLEREPGSAGIDSVKETIKMLAGFNVEANPVSGKKEIRADTFSVQVNANNVYIVDGGYVKPYFEELAFFPNGKNDDQVDASSGAFQLLARNKTRLGVL